LFRQVTPALGRGEELPVHRLQTLIDGGLNLP
jgi:hypothetical protein